MELVDTHTHLYLDDYDPDHTEAVERAIKAGVKWMIFPNVNADSIGPMLELAARYPANTAPCVGLHPSDVKDDWKSQLDGMEPLLAEGHRFVAIGEVGMDLYWDKTYADQQMQALERQLQWARSGGLPVIFHCREAIDETIEVIGGDNVTPGVFHCFGGTLADVERIRTAGDYYFGIGGIVTFKKSKLPDVLPAIGLDRILLETDAPWLAPTPLRGRRNESAYMVHTAQFVADTLGVSIDEVARRTTANARRLFSFPAQTDGNA